MTQSLDPERLDRHLGALGQEVADLRREIEDVAALQKEAALLEALGALAPAAAALGRLEAAGPGSRDEAAEALARELDASFGRLGLRRIGRVGEVEELWPEQARGRHLLDREVSDDAALVRVEVVASGWARGELVVAKPLGRVIEVIP